MSLCSTKDRLHPSILHLDDQVRRFSQPSDRRSLLKQLRSISYRGLQMIFDLLDHREVNVFKRISSMCCVREIYVIAHRLREDGVHVLKLAMVWNLTQIDADDPLLILDGDRLLVHVTRVFGSMIDSSPSISLCVHEFDLLSTFSSECSFGDEEDIIQARFDLFNPQSAAEFDRSCLRSLREISFFIVDTLL